MTTGRTSGTADPKERVAHLNRVLLAIRNVNQLITHEQDPTRLLDRTCELLNETRGYYNAWIALLENGRVTTPVFHAGFVGHFSPMLELLIDNRWPQCARAAIEKGGLHVQNNPEEECRDCPLADAYAGRAGLSIRIEHHNRIIGWLCVSVPTAYAHDPQEHDLLQEVADDIGYALDTIQKQQELEETRTRINRQLEALLTPDIELENLRLGEIINVGEIQRLMNDFYELTHIGIAIADIEGKMLVTTGWQDICTRFHRAHPETRQNCIESDTLLSSGVEPGTWKLYKCKNNMWDMATPIMIGNTHVGNLYLGQFLFDDEPVDRDLFREQARRYGFDEEAYLAALDRVPRWSHERVETVFRFYTRFADMISQLTHSNLTTARALAREKTSEKHYRDLAEALPEMVFELDVRGRLIYANRIAFKKWRYTREDLAEGLSAIKTIIPEDRPRMQQNMQQLMQGKQPGPSPYTALRKDGTTFPILIHSSPIRQHDRIIGIRGLIIDQTEQAQQYKLDQLALKVQARLLQGGAKRSILQDILKDIRQALDLDAAALRLQEGEDFPYYEVSGFPADFIEAERYLCTSNEKGDLLRDASGTVVLECMCGNVIRGRTDSTLPFFTPRGSFWTNSTSRLLAETTEADRQARTRNRCHGEGYESVALIPLPGINGNFGLLQLNDTHTDRFSDTLIRSMENIAHRVGEGLERMVTREALRESENKLRTILNSSPDIILQVDRDLRVMWANEASLKAVPDLIGIPCYQAFIDRDTVCPGCPCRQVLQTGQIERRLMHHAEARGAPGSESYWDTIGVPMKDTQGRVTSVIEIARNVTEIKQSEKRLEQINECLLSLGTDFDENVESITALCGKLFGAVCAIYNRMQGGMLCSLGQWKTPADYNPKDRPDGHICYDVVQQNSDEPLIIRHLHETTYQQTDPNVIAYALKTYFGQLVRCGDEPVGSLCVVFQHDFIPSEEDKRLIGILAAALSKEEAQKKAEEAYSRICRMATDLICVADLETATFTQINPAFEQLLGYSREELLGQPFLNFIHPDDIEPTRRIIEEKLRQGIDIITFENRYRCKNGSWRILEWNSHPVPQEGLIFGIAHDVTERKAAEIKLKKALKDAEAASRAKSAFLANMSHELRTPLNPVIGFTEMLLEEENGLSEEQRECLEIVNRRSQDLLGLLNDILDIARIEADRITVRPEPTDLRALIKDVVMLYELPLAGKDVVLTASVADNVSQTVFLDPLRLRQILVNLVGNAVKFTEEGEIELLAWREDPDTPSIPGNASAETLYFKVRDTGIGIPEAKQAEIFNAFKQADDSFTRKYGGAGLGLAICKRLTRLMGGDISLISDPGMGSTFYFSVHTPPAGIDNGRSEAFPPPAQPAVPRELSILLVEDDAGSRRLAEKMLSREGHRFHSVTDGKDAVDACRENTYDLILMDVKMPVMDGITATRLIRKQEQEQSKKCHTPIMAMTAFAFQEDREACLEAGMDEFVTKPLTPEEFRKKLHRCFS